MAACLSLLSPSKLPGELVSSQSLGSAALFPRVACPLRAVAPIFNKARPQLAAGAAGSRRLRVEAKKSLSDEESAKKGKKSNGLHPALAEAVGASTAVLDAPPAEEEKVSVETPVEVDEEVKPKKKQGQLMYMTESDDLSDKVSSKKEKKEEKKEKEKEKAKKKSLLDDMLQATAHYPDDADAHALASEQSGKKKKKKYDYEAELEVLQVSSPQNSHALYPEAFYAMGTSSARRCHALLKLMDARRRTSAITAPAREHWTHCYIHVASIACCSCGLLLLWSAFPLACFSCGLPVVHL